MYLVFDTETTGIPKNYKAPVSDLGNWPRLVQIAWLIADSDGNEIKSVEHIIKPDGFTIPVDAARIHGISTERALREGHELGAVLAEMVGDIAHTAVLVAHNVQFDEKILGAEFLRAGHPNYLEAKRLLCTMQSATDFCRIPGNYGYKWPTLTELYRKLFSQELHGAHRALADVRACAKCFFELKRLNIIF